MNGNPVNAEDLLNMARADPRRALLVGRQLLEGDGVLLPEARVKALRAMSLAARIASTMEESISRGEESVAAARECDDPDLLVASLVTLAGSLAISGQNDEALSVLREAETQSGGLASAKVLHQRAAVLARMGRWNEAETALRQALPEFIKHGEREWTGLCYQNLGNLALEAGNVHEAINLLTGAVEIFEALRFESLLAGAQHTLGKAHGISGDIPGALHLFNLSESLFVDLVESAAEAQVSRCEVLLSAGLVREAKDLATQVSNEMERRGLGEDRAEAELVIAQAALLAGEAGLALEHAGAAAHFFETQGRETWRAQAEYVQIAARLEKGQADRALLDRARVVANRLESHQQAVASFNARLLAGLIAIAIGDEQKAAADLTVVAGRRSGPVEVRIQSSLAEALLHRISGDAPRALAAAQSGMRLLDSYQAALGATDIRVGIERHGQRLAEFGISLALKSREPRRVFSWMEWSRARSLRFRPVTPPEDEEQAADLASLRQVTEKLRSASGKEASRLARRARELQDSVRDRSRVARGKGSDAEINDLAGEVGKVLAERSLVEFGVIGDELWGILAKDGRFSLRPVGPVQSIRRELESLRFIMRRLARRGGDPDAARAVANRLDKLLFASIKLEDGPVVVAPTPELYATPWSILPTLRHRPLTVTPSAELWLRRAEAREHAGDVVVVGGPGLPEAVHEVEAVGRLYENAKVRRPEESWVEEILAAMDGADVAHIAGHAFFQVENPMFSSLRLADGDLFVYDLERLRRTPRTVVLSACDSGFTESRAGEELLGLSASLLAMGTRSVIASIGLVPDSVATRDLMVEFHRGLLEGLDASHSLRRSQDRVMEQPGGLVAAASFICIGAG